MLVMRPSGNSDTNRGERNWVMSVVAQNNDDGFSIRLSQRHAPCDDGALVFNKIRRVSQASGETIGDRQPCVGARKFAHTLPITPVEAVDIEAEERQFRFARLPLGPLHIG